MKEDISYLKKLSETGYGVTNVISAVTNYFFDSYFAKLDERARSNFVKPKWCPNDPFSHIKEMWLETELYKCVTLNKGYPSFARSLQAWAFSKLFVGDQATWEVVKYLENYEFKDMLKDSFVFRLQSEQISISPTEKLTLPVFGNFFVRSKSNDAHLFVSLDLGYESPGCVVTVMGAPHNQGTVEQFLSDFDASIVANDIYYKQCLTFIQGRLDFIDVTKNCWDDVILKEDLKQKIRDNTVNILDHMNDLASIGMCPNRNVMLISPPGTAKTTIFRSVSSEVDKRMTRIWCTGKSINDAQDVTSLFQAARSMTPCIILLEDADLFGRDRSYGSGSDNYVLNEFLACLDGMQENAGVVVMASTNDIASMDEALVRPGRFDMKIELLMPDANERGMMLRKFLTDMHAKFDSTVSIEKLNSVIDILDGLSGAHLRDFCKSVVIRSVSRCPVSNGCVSINLDDVESGVSQTLENFRLIDKVKKHHVAGLD